MTTEQTDDVAALIERCIAASHDERLSAGMLYREAAAALERLAADGPTDFYGTTEGMEGTPVKTTMRFEMNAARDAAAAEAHFANEQNQRADRAEAEVARLERENEQIRENEGNATFVGEQRVKAIEARCDQYRRDAERLRAALVELVACKDLKDAIDSKVTMTAESERNRLMYLRRKPLAWTAAREAIAASGTGEGA